MNAVPANATDEKEHPCPVRQELQKHMFHRSASLSDVEKSFLSSLLIDDTPTIEDEALQKKMIESASKVLTDDMLFSVPFIGSSKDDSEGNQKAERKQSLPPKPTRSNPQLGTCTFHRVLIHFV